MLIIIKTQWSQALSELFLFVISTEFESYVFMELLGICFEIQIYCLVGIFRYC